MVLLIFHGQPLLSINAAPHVYKNYCIMDSSNPTTCLKATWTRMESGNRAWELENTVLGIEWHFSYTDQRPHRPCWDQGHDANHISVTGQGELY